MSRFYAGQPVVSIWEERQWLEGIEIVLPLGVTIPRRGSRHVVGYSDNDPVVPRVTLRDSVWWAGYDERGFEPVTENQVQAIIAMTTDLPTEGETKKRETHDA